MLKKILALFVAVAVVAFTVGYLKEPSDKELLARNFHPVPAKAVSDLAVCLLTNTCRRPSKLMDTHVAGTWPAVELKGDDGGGFLYMTDGVSLKVIITTILDGQEWPILIEDTGTGLVHQITRLDEKTRRPIVLTEKDRQFQVEFAAAQSVYYKAMTIAVREIIPPPKTGSST